MEESKKEIRKIAALINEFRRIDPDMPIQQAASLLQVALRDGLSLTELANLTEQTQASATRNAQALSKTHRTGKPGLNLVSIDPDPEDGRAKVLRLTTGGKELLERLLSKID